jgi:hypothetical protein
MNQDEPSNGAAKQAWLASWCDAVSDNFAKLDGGVKLLVHANEKSRLKVSASPPPRFEPQQLCNELGLNAERYCPVRPYNSRSHCVGQRARLGVSVCRAATAICAAVGDARVVPDVTLLFTTTTNPKQRQQKS